MRPCRRPTASSRRRGATHDEVAVADDGLAGGSGGTVELSVLADVVVVTHAEVGGILRGGFFVLARGAHDGVGAHDVSATQRRGAGTVRADHGVRPDHAVGAEGGVAEDVHAGTELAVGADGGVV